MNNFPRLRISGLSVLSAIGEASCDWSSALESTTAPVCMPGELGGRPVFRLAESAGSHVDRLQCKAEYRRLDRATLLALAAAESTIDRCGRETPIGCVTLGSSRGPTQALESTYDSFLREEGKVPLLTSPVTTAGNLASWVAQSCLFKGEGRISQQQIAAISTSMTCSSAFHSLLVAVSFIRANLAEACLFGGSEACLTPYTLAQLEALKIYTTDRGIWPCRPLSGEDSRGNSVALGEAAGTAVLHPECAPVREGDLDLVGLGWATEAIPSATGISDDGAAFSRAMQMAASAAAERRIDAVIAHAPGSVKGDQAELRAIRAVFGEVPVYTTKHLTGHTYASSGMVSLSLAQALFESAKWTGLPYPSLASWDSNPASTRVIAVNTAGFGGNAITAIVAKPE